MKDNVFSLEKGLKEKIRLYFDKDLDQTRVLLDEQKRKFAEYQTAVNSKMKATVTESVNYIEQEMKKRIEKFQDVHNAEDMLDGVAKGAAGVRTGGGDLSLQDKYSHLLKKGKTDVAQDPYGITNDRAQQEAIFAEMERLKEGEREAREEVVALQGFIRQARTLQRLREAVKNQQKEYEIDNLKQQLSSNAVLWEQLAEAEKREKILKQELMVV